eukprot:1139818-Pelagomonas_calceolata.AAC.1
MVHLFVASIFVVHVGSFSLPFQNLTYPRLAGFKAQCFPHPTLEELNRTICVPSFALFGYPKAGTSAFWFYLRQHPSVHESPKEQCLDPNSPDSYFKILPSTTDLCASKQKKNREGKEDTVVPASNRRKDMRACIVGDFCIGAAHQHFRAKAYKSQFPIKDVFVLVRNPVAWNYAAYWYWVTEEEKQNKDLMKVVKANRNRRKNISYFKNGAEMWYDFPRSPRAFHDLQSKKNLSSFVDGYISDIQALRAIYNVHVIVNEIFYDDPASVMQFVSARLGLSDFDWKPIVQVAINVGGVAEGPGAQTPKQHGKYPPYLAETEQLYRSSTQRYCLFVSAVTGKDVCRLWLP